VINKVILIGNLGKDPEIKYTTEDRAVVKFSLATSTQWKDKDSGELRKRTEWHRLTAFGRLAEICYEYLEKGKQVYVEGRLQTNTWEKDDITMYSTEIIINEMKMLGKRADNSKGYKKELPPVGTDKEEDDIPF